MSRMELSTQMAIFGRIALGVGLGFVVGLERELRGKNAGERTIALVAGGAASFAAVAHEVFPDTGGQVLAGVATGIGFLGVGVIWRMGMGPARGLTTAAAAWTVAAIGVLAGLGLYLVAILSAIVTVAILEIEYIPLFRPIRRSPDDPTERGAGPEGSPGSAPGA